MQKLKVGVLMGGKSIEREVSFNSGRTICDHLDSQRYDVVPLFQTTSSKIFILPWRFLHRGKIADFEHRLTQEAHSIAWDELKNYVDFIYIAFHGRYGEDGSLQGFLEILGIPYLGSKVFASALGMDKFLQKDFLTLHGITVARDIRVSSTEIANSNDTLSAITQQLDEAGISFPCVVKPRKEGSSLGVSIAHNNDELSEALKKASAINPYTLQDVLVEEKIEGMEFTCIIITDTTGALRALPPTEVIKEHTAAFFDYEQKYMPGKALKFTPARCQEDTLATIQATCIAVMQILAMKTIGRIDGFLTHDNQIIIIDPNTFSGMAPSSFIFCQAAHIDMNHSQLINHLIETELKNYTGA